MKKYFGLIVVLFSVFAFHSQMIEAYQDLRNNINTWNADNYFKSGRPWADVRAYGATGNGTTDDTTAIQAAVTAVNAFSGGTVYFPPGIYCAKTGVTDTGGNVRFVGGANEQNGVVISACNANVVPLTMNGFGDTLEHIYILGDGIGTTQPALSVLSGCTECVIEDSRMTGGNPALYVNGPGGMWIDKIYAGNSYGTSIAYFKNTQSFIFVDKLDQGWPGATPSAGTNPSAWASSTAYTLNTVVYTQGYYIQCTHAGTSGSSAPTLANYLTTITDGSNGLTWQLVGPTTYYAMQIDTAVNSLYEYGGDHTGPFTAGIALTNSASGQAPNTIGIFGGTFGQNWQSGIYAHDGDALEVVGGQFANCIYSGCQGIFFTANWKGDTSVTGTTMFGNPLGIDINNTGANYAITGNNIFGSTTAAIKAEAGQTSFVISGNNVGTSAVWGANTVGIAVSTGASNHYNIVNNIVSGATTGVSDGGSGSAKTVSGNN